MLLYNLPLFVTPLPDIALIIKDNANDGKYLPSCPFSAIMTLFSVVAFINEELRGCTNEEVLVLLIKQPKARYHSTKRCTFFFLFHVLLFQLHQQLIDLIFLVTLKVISSLQMNKVNPVPALTAPTPFVTISHHSITFVSNLSNTGEVALVATLGKTLLACFFA